MGEPASIAGAGTELASRTMWQNVPPFDELSDRRRSLSTKHVRLRACLGGPILPGRAWAYSAQIQRRTPMFKKSEEQEWSRFRGALAKDRDDPGSTQHAATESSESTPAPSPSAAASTASAATSASMRNLSADVNVGLPSSRLSRSVVADSGEAETLIGERSHFEGTLKCEGSVRLMGSVQGEIQSASTIIVEEKAHVTARLTAGQVTIAGQVDGQVYCQGRVEIRPTGRVTGEISAGALIVQEGAYFDGNSKMATPAGRGEGSTASAPSAATAPTSAPAPAAAAGRASG
ncbi:MAG: polymer-forming cytoskeletal protein [Chloroflexota bacterium]|nr:polymer-forming cytoskeletal protein [Chloroflexota bacterium]